MTFQAHNMPTHSHLPPTMLTPCTTKVVFIEIESTDQKERANAQLSQTTASWWWLESVTKKQWKYRVYGTPLYGDKHEEGWSGLGFLERMAYRQQCWLFHMQPRRLWHPDLSKFKFLPDTYGERVYGTAYTTGDEVLDSVCITTLATSCASRIQMVLSRQPDWQRWHRWHSWDGIWIGTWNRGTTPDTLHVFLGVNVSTNFCFFTWWSYLKFLPWRGSHTSISDEEFGRPSLYRCNSRS